MVVEAIYQTVDALLVSKFFEKHAECGSQWEVKLEMVVATCYAEFRILLIFASTLAVSRITKRNKIITTLVIGPLDDHTYCTQSGFTHLRLWHKL